MAATALNYDGTQLLMGPGTWWGSLAVPADDAVMTLTSGTPDGVENASAVHFGHTRSGIIFNCTPQFEEHKSDEFEAPIKVKNTGLDMSLEGEVLQVSDKDVVTPIVDGFGTYASAGTNDEFRFGTATFSTECVAYIYPQEADPAKYGVIMLYAAYNVSGISSLAISRAGLSGISVNWKATAVTTRSSDDTVGIWWEEQ